MNDRWGRFGGRVIASAITHLSLFLLTLFVIDKVPVTPPSNEPPDRQSSDVVWLNVPGPGHAGRTGGDGKPAAPHGAERPRQDALAVRAGAPLELVPEPLKDAPRPDTDIVVRAMDQSVGIVDLPGALTGLPTLSWQSSGPGAGQGIGTGPRGSGFGDGDDAGIGTGAFGPGTGVTMPTVLIEVKPAYTADAMRAKVQGAVTVEAVVRADGTVGQVRIVRSLDRTYGLDQEALKAVRNWRFKPGMRQGRNVPVLVEIELTFTLR